VARKVARKQKYITKEKNMKYLLVVAHPDDEVLGAGASIWKWAHNGD